MPVTTNGQSETMEAPSEATSERRTNKSLERAVRDAAIQMGCWTASDDYLLIASVLHLCDLERVHERAKFSMAFSLQNIEDRWQCLLYHAPISKMIVGKVQQLSMLQVESLRIPFSEQEELLVASIPSHIVPALLDNELDMCLSRHSNQFWSNRTIDELRECWYQLRQDGRLHDQLEARHSQRTQSSPEHAVSNRLATLLAPFEFELLSRHKEQFEDKTDLPHALVHVNNRLYCMYSDELKFGTASASDQQLDITLDNLTTIHIQGMILRKADAFYIVNNGEHAFRVNDALLHPNEAGSLGTRAILSILEHTMVFQALELPQ